MQTIIGAISKSKRAEIESFKSGHQFGPRTAPIDTGIKRQEKWEIVSLIQITHKLDRADSRRRT